MSLLLSLVAWVRSSLLLLSPYASPARPRDHAGSLRSFPLLEEHNDEVVRNRKGEQRGREGKGREGGRGSQPHFFLLLPVLQSAVIPPPFCPLLSPFGHV